jgi:hypothetical protein
VVVTDQRLLIVANRLERLLRGRSWDIPLRQIRASRMDEPGGGEAKARGLSAQLRPQIVIDIGGEDVAFVVRDPDAVLSALSANSD